METSTDNRIIPKFYDKIREYRKEKKLLFGLIRWERVIKTDCVGEEFHLFTNGTPIKEVFVNGERFILTNPNQSN